VEKIHGPYLSGLLKLVLNTVPLYLRTCTRVTIAKNLENFFPLADFHGFFYNAHFCTPPDIGGFFHTVLLGRIFVQHLALVNFFPKPDFGGLPDFGGFFSPPAFRGFFTKRFTNLLIAASPA
jgi:hypothetical protein